MTDKTLGAYQRHETPDCTAEHGEYVCTRETGHPGPHIAATCVLNHAVGAVWDEPVDLMDGGVTAALIEQEVEARPPSIGLLETALRAALDAERAVIEEREEARAMAALWKEATREHIGRARTALSYASAVQVARAVASVTPCSCSAQRARAEKAEKERDEALRTLKEVLDSHDETLREIAEGKYAAESRPLTPDAITDEMVKRGVAVLLDCWPNARLSGRAPGIGVRELLTAALTEPPARTEGLTRLIDTIREATYDPEPVATGEALYNAGVRVVTEDGAA